MFEGVWSFCEIGAERFKAWIKHKKDKAVKIMIKTEILLWKTMDGNSRETVKGLGLGLRLGFIYFILNSHTLIRDVWHTPDFTSTEKYEEAKSDEHPPNDQKHPHGSNPTTT